MTPSPIPPITPFQQITDISPKKSRKTSALPSREKRFTLAHLERAEIGKEIINI
jgi:hypothetical protein